MTYSLEAFCSDARSILTARDTREGHDELREKFEGLLREPEFLDAYVGRDSEPGVAQIYEDPVLGFCILAYNMAAPRTSPPHDHGESWAIYGQTQGYTDMTIWSTDGGGITPVREFRLDAGQAGLFDVREIHSIEYTEGAKFVRVTGADMSQETRRVWDAQTGEVTEVEAVGTGN